MSITNGIVWDYPKANGKSKKHLDCSRNFGVLLQLGKLSYLDSIFYIIQFLYIVTNVC